MPRTHIPYTAEYGTDSRGLREPAAALPNCRASLSPVETIRQGFKQAELGEGQRSYGLTTSEREEFNGFRARTVSREEREIFSRAPAGFAQETGATPSWRPHS